MAKAAERETVITWSDADRQETGKAQIYTAQREMVTRLRKIRGAERVTTYRTDKGEWTGEQWAVPIGAVLPRNPIRGTPRKGAVPPWVKAGSATSATEAKTAP